MSTFKVIRAVLSGLPGAAIPVIQFGLVFRLWDKYNKPVNKDLCACSCWDTVFKGGYETGVAGYKHFYFNSNASVGIIWTFTVVALISSYEATKHLITHWWNGTARNTMVILYLSVLYPHYYAWWAFVNYYNDDYFDQFWHQTFFTVTELASTSLVLRLVDKSVPVTPRKTIIIMGIAILHILASGWDQFVENVLKREGELHQVLRDLGFMIPDILHLVLPWKELQKVGRRRGVPPSHLVESTDFSMVTLSVFFLWMFSSFVL